MSILKVKDGSTWVDIPAIVGPAGEDGYSPTVDVQEIEGGHEVTITDATGAHTFDVMDGSSDDSLTAQVAQLWGNQLTKELTGEVLAASDVYAAPPMAVTVDGKSTQDGTPAPDAPVEIESVESVNLALTKRNVFDTNFTQEYTMYGLTIENDGTGVFKVTTTITDGGVRARIFGKTKEIFGTSAYVGNYTIDPSTATHLPAGTYKVVTSADDANTHIGIGYGRAGATGGGITTARNGATITSDGSLYYYGCIWTGNASTIPASGLYLYVMLMRSEVSTPTSYEPYSTSIVQVPINDNVLRSLPDGTKDTLALSYLRPSTREGWAVYQATLTALVGVTTTAATDGITGTVGVDVMSTTGEIADGPTVLYKLASAQTTQLDPIELPQLPAPNATVWCDGGSATPTFTMQYVRDTTIVIQQLEAAIADLATS